MHALLMQVADAKEEEMQLLSKQRRMRMREETLEESVGKPVGKLTGSVQAQIRGRLRLQRYVYVCTPRNHSGLLTLHV